ncbi:shikimate dehydrogenase family protein [Microbacterium sp.]|uniref:shikimate dehydrogenase family protein n=1 Tax=Microbacterium sp. TaxID=51671 RepID=UPI0039E593D8
MSECLLEVWGDPVAHSLSPRMHAAAYAHLGWDWSYGRRRVDAAGFAAELASLGARYRGLSLTHPLKAEAFRASADHDRNAELTGAVNTLVIADGRLGGFNTDVGGIVADLRALEASPLDRARIIGAGATAMSALVALGELGTREVEILARRPEAAAVLVALGARIGVTVTVADATAVPASVSSSAPLTISTLPGGAALPEPVTDMLAAGGGLLYDVVYGHWPTPLATAWQDAGARAVNGLGMLLHQAVLQIRAFATGGVTEPLPDEDAVVDVMRAALVED